MKNFLRSLMTSCVLMLLVFIAFCSFAEAAPNPPSNFQCIRKTAHQIYLCWTDSTNEARYRITCKSITHNDPIRVDDYIFANSTAWSILNLRSNSEYQIFLEAVAKDGSASSPLWISVFTLPAPLPSAPANIRVANVGLTAATIFWDHDLIEVTGFKIYRKNLDLDRASWVLVNTIPPVSPTTSYTDTGLLEDTKYGYQVYAINDTGNSESAFVDLVTLSSSPVQGSIIINNGAKYALSRNVLLTLNASSSAGNMNVNGMMRFSINNNFNWSGWENYNVTKEVALINSNFVQSVYVMFKDSNNNISSSHIQSSIALTEPAKMAGVSYLEGTAGTQGIVMNFGQRAGIKLYNKSTGVPQVIHSMAGDPAPECKSITRARLNSSSYDDLVVDFGPVYGIWVCSNCKTWNLPLHPLTAESITAADINNDGKDEVIIDFGAFTANPYKLWIYYPANGTWSPLHSISPRSVTAGNIDGLQGIDLVVDFGIYGLWIWYDNANWGYLHPLTSDQIELGDINADGRDEIIVNFGQQWGVWAYYPKVTDPNLKWNFIEGQSPKMMDIGHLDVDGSARKDVLFDFGTYADTLKKSGLWIWANDTNLLFLHPLTSYGTVVQGYDLVVDFGPDYGEYIYKSNSTSSNKWVFLEPLNAE